MDLTAKRLEGELIAISGIEPGKKREAYAELTLNVNGKEFIIDQFISMDINCDFVNAYSDKIMLVWNMPLGDFIYDIYPNRDDVTATITRYSIGNKHIERLNLIFSELDEKIESGLVSKASQNELNQEMARLKAEAVDRTIVKMREVSVSGIAHNASPGDVLASKLMESLHILPSLYGLLPSGLKMVPGDNSRQYKNIVIPSDTTALLLARYLQDHYGIYNGGIGQYRRTFGTDSYYYIYPLFRPNLFGLFSNKLHIIAYTDATAAGIDATYALDGDTLKVIVSNAPRNLDDETKLRSLGQNIRSTESDTIMRRPFEVAPDGVRVSESNLQRKMQHKKTKTGEVGPVLNDGVTSNLYKTRSEVLLNDGVFVQVTWKNSNARFLKPMMPVVYLEERNGEVKQREGLLHHCKIMLDNNSKSEVTVMTLFLKIPRDGNDKAKTMVQQLF